MEVRVSDRPPLPGLREVSEVTQGSAPLRTHLIDHYIPVILCLELFRSEVGGPGHPPLGLSDRG